MPMKKEYQWRSAQSQTGNEKTKHAKKRSC